MVQIGAAHQKETALRRLRAASTRGRRTPRQTLGRAAAAALGVELLLTGRTLRGLAFGVRRHTPAGRPPRARASLLRHPPPLRGERGPAGDDQVVGDLERPLPRFLESGGGVGGPGCRTRSVRRAVPRRPARAAADEPRRSGAVTADRVAWLSARAAPQSPPANRISSRTVIARR